VFPAYRKFAEFLRTEYDPKGRTELTIESLADGKRRYAEAVKTMTTVNVPPADVHDIGLKEVARITAEMTKLAQGQGYKDPRSLRESRLFSSRFAFCEKPIHHQKDYGRVKKVFYFGRICALFTLSASEIAEPKWLLAGLPVA
jgi:uncharacterized protein (DUF885 family)